MRLPNMIFRVYRPTNRESRDLSSGFMMIPPSKSRRMTEACNVKWADPCHWTKWRGVACCEHRRTGESQEGGWDSTPADVRSIGGHDERVPDQQIRVGEGPSIRLRSLYRRDLDRWSSSLRVGSAVRGAPRGTSRSCYSSSGRTQVHRHEALALRFQSLSSVTFEGCLHSVV